MRDEKWAQFSDKVLSRTHAITMLKKRKHVQDGFSDLRYYFIFVCLFVGVTFMQLETNLAFKTQNTLSTWYVRDPWENNKNLYDVGEWDDIWSWMDHAIEKTWENWQKLNEADDYSGYTTVSEYNAIVGAGIYLKQERSNIVDCVTSKLQDITEQCYDVELGNKDSYGSGDMTFTYNELMGGFTELLPVSNFSKADALAYKNKLMENGWIDRQTRVITVQFYFYNGNSNFFTRASIIFDLLVSGTVYPQAKMSCVNVEPYLEDEDWMRLAFEILFAGAIALAVLAELWEVINTRIKQGSFSAYFSSLWNYFDIVSLFLFVVMGAMWIFYASYTVTFTAPPAGHETYSDVHELQNDVDVFATIMLWYHRINAINFFLVMVRFFKFVRYQGKMSLLTNTISQAGNTIFHFIIIGAVVFTGFAMMGNFNFGHALYEFRTFAVSFNTCFRYTLGDFDYGALHEVDPIGAFVFFWGLMVLVYLIGMNMFIAILLEEYGDLKSTDTFSRTIFDEINEGAFRRILWAKNFFRRTILKQPNKYKSIDEQIEMLEDLNTDVLSSETLADMFGKTLARKLLKHFGQDPDRYQTFSDDDVDQDDDFVTSLKGTLTLLEAVKEKRKYKEELKAMADI